MNFLFSLISKFANSLMDQIHVTKLYFWWMFITIFDIHELTFIISNLRYQVKWIFSHQQFWLIPLKTKIELILWLTALAFFQWSVFWQRIWLNVALFIGVLSLISQLWCRWLNSTWATYHFLTMMRIPECTNTSCGQEGLAHCNAKPYTASELNQPGFLW